MLFSIRWHRAIESLGIDVMCLFFDGSEQFLEVLMSLLRLMGAKYEVMGRRFGFTESSMQSSCLAVAFTQSSTRH